MSQFKQAIQHEIDALVPEIKRHVELLRQASADEKRAAMKRLLTLRTQLSALKAMLK